MVRLPKSFKTAIDEVDNTIKDSASRENEDEDCTDTAVSQAVHLDAYFSDEKSQPVTPAFLVTAIIL